MACAVFGAFFCAATIWCVAHAVRVEILIVQREEAEAKHPHMWACALAADEDEKAFEAIVGLPLERTIPAGVLASGFAMVLGIQAVRLLNRGRGLPR
jgi:hypothetical protein